MRQGLSHPPLDANVHDMGTLAPHWFMHNLVNMTILSNCTTYQDNRRGYASLSSYLIVNQ
jgi:hypothetical protein